MQINVGTVLTMKGKKWYCRSIEVFKQTKIADNWDVINWSGYAVVNQVRVQVLATEIAKFVEGDVIHREYESLDFKEVEGPDWLVIYTYYKVRKEKASGLERAESSDKETASSQA